jgi:hypothetical protein
MITSARQVTNHVLVTRRARDLWELARFTNLAAQLQTPTRRDGPDVPCCNYLQCVQCSLPQVSRQSLSPPMSLGCLCSITCPPSLYIVATLRL